MKAPATRKATSGKPASAASRSGAAAGRVSPVAKAPAKGSSKLVSKPVPKPAAKAKVKPASPAPVAVKSKPAAKPAVKTGSKVSPKVAPKPIAKAPVKAAAKTTGAKAAAKPAAKAAPSVQPRQATKAAVKPPVKPTVKPVTKTVAAPVPKTPPPAPVAIEPSPKPLGKRAAKKIMMEQMTQAAVVPSHAPDAAKATFFTLNERPVMTPPVPSSIQKDPKRANNWKSLPVEQLTDQDILSMPDSEYMNDVQLAYFRRKLSQLKADMLANAGETTEHLREDTVVVPDPADRATIEEEHALELRTRDRERKLLKKIEQAIARIDGGDYGYCDETGEPIGVGRLMARPTASLSLEAQQRRELKQKMFGD